MAIHIYTIFIFFLYRFLSIGSSLPANRNNMAWQSLPNPHLNQFAKKVEVDIFRTANSKVRSVFLFIVVKTMYLKPPFIQSLMTILYIFILDGVSSSNF